MPEAEGIEIHERIDSGLYGSVYRATQQPLGRQVAVKIIKTDLKTADALAHAAPLARANHPAIVTIFTVQEVHLTDRGLTVPAIVMEWVEGDTLGKRLSLSKFKIEEAASLCRDVLSGIEHLHEIGICHGDLHPGNIIVLPTGHAKIIDVDANKEISLGRLSALSQEGAKASDVDYCRSVVFRLLRHSEVPLSVLANHEQRLEGAKSIRALQNVVDSLLNQVRHVETPLAVNSELHKSDGDGGWLSGIATTNASAEDVIALLDTQAYYDLLKVAYPDSRAGVLKHLEEEGVIRRFESNWNITNLGAILFAKKLDSFGPSLSRKAARFIVYDGVNKLKTRIDMPGNRGYAVGFKGLVDYVHDAAPRNEFLEVAIREEIKMFPQQALRELIANAMVHQDFSVDGTALRIEMYDDRVEISNPGVPSIPPERFIDEDLSRNEMLAELMRRLGVCERKGSGVDKVVIAAELFQLPAPDFRVGETRTTALLFAHQNFADMTKSDRVRACYQHSVIQYLSGKRMSNQSLRERFGLAGTAAGSATASQVIASAKDANFIKPDDEQNTSLRYARYLPWWG